MSARLQAAALGVLALGAAMARHTVWTGRVGRGAVRQFATEAELAAYHAGADAFSWGRDVPATGPARTGYYDALATADANAFSRG